MRIILILILVLFLTGCSRISLDEKGININTDLKVNESVKTTTNYDTPEIVKIKTLDQTEAVDFGNII